MADNSSVPVASGNETFANDDIGGVKYPRPKINWGPDGTANDVDVASGKPLPVQLRSPTGTDLVGTAGTGSAAVITVQGNASGTAIPVSVATIPSHAVTNAGTFAVQDSEKIADDAAFTVGTSKVQPAGYLADESSTDSVDEGDVGAARMTLDRKQIFTAQPHTSGGLSIFRSLDLDETEEEVKSSAGCLYKLRITNRASSARYVKIYNAALAGVTVGTTTPVDTIVVPGASSADLATVITENFGGLGLAFDTAICLAATTGLADNDTGAPSANDVVVTAYYK